MNIRFFLDDKEVNAPANWQSLAVQLNYDSDAPDSRVTINDWEWIKENSNTLKAWINQGLLGSIGVFEGVPFRIEIADSGANEVLYNGYLDLSTSIIECDKVTARAKEVKSIDYVNDIADSFTFEYLAENGNAAIVSGIAEKTIYIPYVISKLPAAQEAILAAVSLITLIIELENANKSLFQYIIGIEVFSWEDLFKIIIMVIYITFLIATIVKITQDLFNAIIQPVKYHAGMRIIDLCRFGSQHMGFEFASETILELEEFDDVCIIPEKWNIEQNNEIEYLQGFTQISEISKVIPGQKKQQEQGYYNGTFGQLLRDLKTMFNAKVVIEESTTGGLPLLRLERVDYSKAQELYNIPPIDNNDRFTLNAEDFNANYLVEFALDSAEQNTFTQYQGTSYQVITTPKTTPTDKTLMKGLNQVSIPFALGKRKNNYTVPEDILIPIVNEIWQITQSFAILINGLVATTWLAGNVIITQINNVISTVNALPATVDIPLINPNLLGSLDQLPLFDIVDFGNVNNRIGMLLLENDFINVPKVVKLDVNAIQSTDLEYESNLFGFPIDVADFVEAIGGLSFSGIDYESNRLNADNITILSAENLYKKFHYINSFVPTDVADTNGSDLTPQLHNQWKIYEFENVPFCFEDYLKVRNDNKIIFVDKFGLVESIDWNIFDETANIRFRVNELYTLNLENKELIPLGR
jgi:hypothetical protein